MLCVDVAFITSSGSPYNDYAAVALQSVPEPSSLVLAAVALVGVAGLIGAARRSGAEPSQPLEARAADVTAIRPGRPDDLVHPSPVCQG